LRAPDNDPHAITLTVAMSRLFRPRHWTLWLFGVFYP
jgi:hypothetical protein